MIYLIGEQPTLGPVKIGYTLYGAPYRLAMLRHPSEGTIVPAHVDRSALSLLALADGNRQVEYMMHCIYAGQRIEGEWFNLGWSVNAVVSRFDYAVREAQHRMTMHHTT